MQTAITTTFPASKQMARTIAKLAVEALLEEVNLTPKPGLVDNENSGCHYDLNLPLMTASAESLFEAFYDMAMASANKEPSQQLREQLAAIGRYGEQQMLKVTGNINTHKGAIWCLGLLSAASAIVLSQSAPLRTISKVFKASGNIAGFADRFLPAQITHGSKMREKYNVIGAREEAIHGFPSISDVALPAAKIFRHNTEEITRLNMLLALMATVDDTCILHRSNMAVLESVQQRSAEILKHGGLGIPENWTHYLELDNYISTQWVSPGGSADLLAGAIFIQKISIYFNFK